MLGGRVFPGVHRRVRLEVESSADRISWSVRDDQFPVDLDVSLVPGSAAIPDIVGETCIGADFGISPRHRSGVDVVRMDPTSRQARLVRVDHLSSKFLSGFKSLTPAASYLMEDVGVTWTSVSNGPHGN
jgi:hypothetical protein